MNNTLKIENNFHIILKNSGLLLFHSKNIYYIELLNNSFSKTLIINIKHMDLMTNSIFQLFYEIK